jgi:hypothetical protein
MDLNNNSWLLVQICSVSESSSEKSKEEWIGSI